MSIIGAKARAHLTPAALRAEAAELRSRAARERADSEHASGGSWGQAMRRITALLDEAAALDRRAEQQEAVDGTD